jgi:O-antigen/teichoic acid export membrane protein
MLVSVPLTSGYLGEERYAVWLSVSSFVALLTFADLGIGVGLLNAVSHAFGKDDVAAARRHIATALALLMSICIVLISVGLLLMQTDIWAEVFNVKTPIARSEVNTAATLFMIMTALNLPLGVVQRVQLGFQEGAPSYIWQALGSLLGLALLVLAVRFRLGLPWLILAYMGGPALASLANGVLYFGVRRPELRFSRKWIHRESARILLRTGVGFVILQILVAVTNSMDYIIIAQRLTSGDLAGYSLTVRLFSVIMLLIGTVTAALWPAFSEAHSRGDHGWLSSTFEKAVRISFATMAIGSVVVMVTGQWLVDKWSVGSVSIGLTLLAARACYSLVDSVVGVTGTLLSSMNMIWIQVIAIGSYVAVSLIAKPWAADVAGVTGIAGVGALAMGLFVLWPLWRSAAGTLSKVS